MKKNSSAGKEKKVSLIRCLNVFDHIKLPWPLLITAFLFTIFSAWMSLTTVTFSGNAVDASGNIPTEELFKYIFATVSSLILLVIGGIAGGFANVRIQYLVRNKLWHKIMVTKQKNFDRDGGEALVSRVTSDCEYSSKFFEIINNLTNIIIGSAMYIVQLWIINRKIATWILVFIPICGILGAIYNAMRFVVFLKNQARLSDATAYLAERTKDLNLVKTCNAQQEELEKGQAFFKAQYKAQLNIGFSAMFATVIGTIMDVFAKVVPFAIGAVLVANGEITVGVLVTINSLFTSIAGVFGNIVLRISEFKEANGALARVTLFFEEEEESLEIGDTLADSKNEDIVFDHVKFGYTEDKQVLGELTCRIPKNKVTAVVGTNGSGKSTMFKLITRLYEPDMGTVAFGGQDASGYTLNSWRNKICLIAQGSPMMAGTLRENICYGRKDVVSDEELMRVAKLSHVWDFVKDLPDGFDSEVTAGGGNFSGGQRQCIAIARAMMSKSEYVLMDEITSNLDVKREKDVMEAMAELMKGRTAIIIAHSLSAIRNADHVIVLNKGKLEAEGAPSQILDKTDNYLQKMMKRKQPVAEAGA